MTPTPWFRPEKYFDWSGRILTGQRRAVSAVLIAVLVGALAVFYRTAPALAAAGAIMIALLVVVLLIGDPPGRAHSRP
jgi:hypothetical protein